MRASLLAGVILLAACSSNSSNTTGGPSSTTGDCSAPGKCANDPPIPDAVVSLCKASLADTKCGASYSALLSCSRENQKCTSEGKSTGTMPPECKTQNDAYVACLNASKDAG